MKSIYVKIIDFIAEFRCFNKKKLRIMRYALFLVFATWYSFALPEKIFNDKTSTVLFDRNGNLLGAKIAEDGQWRFPETTVLPSKFKKCIVEFSKKRFQHLEKSLEEFRLSKATTLLLIVVSSYVMCVFKYIFRFF